MNSESKIIKNDRKIILAWSFYDWANSAYNLVITSTIFPIYYDSITRTDTTDLVQCFGISIKNTVLYTYAISLSYLIVAFISPILSGIADSSGMKKIFWQFFCFLGSASCCALFWFTNENIEFGILMVMLACIGWSGSIVYYNSYLPEIASNENQNRVSAKGFAMGYIGSSILLIANLIVVLNPNWFGIEDASLPPRISFLATGIWWFGFALIPFLIIPNSSIKREAKNLILKGYVEIIKVYKQIKNQPELNRFLTAFFIYNMGVQTVMLVATLFGSKELHLETGQLITTILLIQFIAIGGAYLFSASAKKYGNITILMASNFIWIGVCCMAYFVNSATQFYLLALIVGLMMGGIQSLSRSTYSKLISNDKESTSYFSFYDFIDKLSIVCGMAIFGFIEMLGNNMRQPIIALMIFFILGYLLLLRVKRTN